jgi:hypothetical protein
MARRVSDTAVMNGVSSFFFIITSLCAAVPLHRRISNVKHVASWVTVLGLFERYFQHCSSRFVGKQSFKFFCNKGFTKLYVLTPPRI